jgi:hypothetical protein
VVCVSSIVAHFLPGKVKMRYSAYTSTSNL